MIDEKFYTITQTSKITGIKPHVLRYWEKEFRWLKPQKNSAGRRIYSERDVELIRLIDRLVHHEGYSISGARKRVSVLLSLSNQLQLPLDKVKTELLQMIKSELSEIRDVLERK